jgi:hypothetical protein
MTIVAAGVEFTNGEQPGVRLTKPAAANSSKFTGGPKPVIAAKAGRSKWARSLLCGAWDGQILYDGRLS